MHPFRKQLSQNPIAKFFSSIHITVICLTLLFILTFLGTLDQVGNGLYLAQEKYFNSMGFLLWGFCPFPGARLVMWVLFVNLVSVSLTRLVYRWTHLGIIITHFGLLMFFVAAFFTFHGVQESNVTFMEGEGTNLSSAYHIWEVSVWTESEEQRHVEAYTLDRPAVGKVFSFGDDALALTVDQYFVNSDAYLSADEPLDAVNDSGIQMMKPLAVDVEPSKNLPGVIFDVAGQGLESFKVVLFGGESEPTRFNVGDTAYAVQLRRRRTELPFIIKLKDFRMTVHPNTQMARSYESLVELVSPEARRETLISMNKPLRYKAFTFYQASYAVDEAGRMSSTLAVVQNKNRLWPYIASGTTSVGLLIHLLMMAFKPRTRRRSTDKKS